MDSEMTGIVLAGGKATRMGGAYDKAFLKVDNETIINRQLRILKQIFKEIIIVTNSTDSYKDIKGVTIVSDIIRERGPMGGIYSGLLASYSFYNFVVACDMPFLNESIIRYMISNTRGYDVIMPKIDGRDQPLFCVYSKKCVSVIERLIEEGRLNVSGIFPVVRSRYIGSNQLKKFDPPLTCFTNINMKEDYEECLISR